MTGRPRKYQSAADRQAAYRNRQRVTKCPQCGSGNTIPVPEEAARQFGVYCECLCFQCNGLVSDTGAVWGFVARAHDLPEWVAIEERPS
jgi:hypothetical protein